MRFSNDIRRRSPSAAAMIETVLVLPVVALVLLLLLGLGRSMGYWQQVSMMDRYEAWRQVAGAPGPAMGGGDHPQLNSTFLRGRAVEIDITRDDYFPQLPTSMMREAAAAYSTEAGWLADRMIERLPDGRRVRVNASFAPSGTLDERLGLAGPMSHTHVRLNHEWRFATGSDEAGNATGPYVSLNQTVRDYMSDRFAEFRAIDEYLQHLERERLNEVAASIRDLYLNDPPYRGPDM